MLQRNNTFGLLITCSLLLLGACSSSETKTEADTSEDNLAVRTVSGSLKGAFEAAQSPLVDLNLTRDEIPDTLQKISGSPYTLPAPLQCKIMSDEIEQLDAALGPDIGPKKAKSLFDKDTDYVGEGASLIQDNAIGFVAGKASILPFRGVVREITGASKHSKEVTRAYESGKLRRAYLKGISTALKCDKVKEIKKPAVQEADKKDTATKSS